MALTVAGSDSSGGAGIQADLRTFSAFGVWGAVAVTAVTAQNRMGVQDVTPVPVLSVAAQIDSVATDMEVAAVKTGMLASAETVRAVADAIHRYGLGPVVVDPVLVSTTGGRLLEPEAVRTIGDCLLPGCHVFTPNLPEAEVFLEMTIQNRDEMEEAAHRIGGLGPVAVVLKGGHLGGDDSPDLLWERGRILWMEGPRIRSSYAHGTGCAYSAAVAANLARGRSVEESCWAAKAFVAEALQAGGPVG